MIRKLDRRDLQVGPPAHRVVLDVGDDCFEGMRHTVIKQISAQLLNVYGWLESTSVFAQDQSGLTVLIKLIILWAGRKPAAHFSNVALIG